MPQKLTPVWISELKDDAETIHSDWLHRLANLTLTAYNSKYSNSPFSEKKTMQDGYLQSGIKMNQRVAQKEHWGLAELEERCGYLTQQAIQLWPYAASSYTPPQKQYDEVALDDEINLTGRTLVKYRFRGIEHDTTSWAEMYAAVLKELHNADKSYLNYLADADDSVDLSIHVSRTSDNYTSCVKVDEDIYVWTGTATQYKINLLRKFLEQYKQDPFLFEYYERVMNWVYSVFPKNYYRREMQGVDWGLLYHKFHQQYYDAKEMEERVAKLMANDEVKNKKGIYTFVFDGDESSLNLRQFSASEKRVLYERCGGFCKRCGPKIHYKIEEMEADHIKPWSDGGKTELDNGQMLCKHHNRVKGNK